MKYLSRIENNLLELLNSGTTGTLDCPKCHIKMKEIHLGYKKSRMMSRHEEIMKDPKKITGEMVLEFLPIIGALIKFGRFISEVGGDATKGKLKKTVTIDGCSSCMLSQAQAYVADITGSGKDISIALGQFQGFAVGQ